MNEELTRLYKLDFKEFYEIRKHISDTEIDNFRKIADNNLSIVILYKEIEYSLKRIQELDENKRDNPVI